MGDRVECLLEVHKAHIEWLLVLACLVHQYSEIRDLISWTKHCSLKFLTSRQNAALTHLRQFFFVFYTFLGWWRSTVVERRSLTGKLSLSCARPAADG